MLFSYLVELLTEKYPDLVYETNCDNEISDLAPYKPSLTLPASDCLCLYTAKQLAAECALPANLICVGIIDEDTYNRLRCSASNYILVPEASSSEAVCHIMSLFGNSLKQQKLYSELIYMLLSDLDLGSIFSEFSKGTGRQMLAIDISGKILAYSKPFVINHPNWQRSVEVGYLDQFLIEYIFSYRVRNKMSLSTKPFILYCDKLKLHIKVVRIVSDGELIGYVFMGSDSKEFPHFSDRFMQALAKKLQHTLISNRDSKAFRVNMHQNIIADIIEGAGEEEIIMRIKAANLIFPPQMRALVINTGFFRGTSYIYSTLMPEISAILPDAPKLIKNGNIVVLLEVNCAGEIKSEIYEQLNDLSKSLSLLIGISNVFNHVAQFARYYHQALDAQLFAKRIPCISGVFFFSDFAFNIMLNSIEDKSFLDHVRHPLISAIEKYDCEKNTEFYDTLKIYAQTGFSKNKTAELMFLHRNTVNYRIQQIENLFSVDFNEPTLLFKLLYSFYIDSFLKNRYGDLIPRPGENPTANAQ